jgi:hypothetical protein
MPLNQRLIYQQQQNNIRNSQGTNSLDQAIRDSKVMKPQPTKI